MTYFHDVYPANVKAAILSATEARNIIDGMGDMALRYNFLTANGVGVQVEQCFGNLSELIDKTFPVNPESNGAKTITYGEIVGPLEEEFSQYMTQEGSSEDLRKLGLYASIFCLNRSFYTNYMEPKKQKEIFNKSFN